MIRYPLREKEVASKNPLREAKYLRILHCFKMPICIQKYEIYRYLLIKCKCECMLFMSQNFHIVSIFNGFIYFRFPLTVFPQPKCKGIRE